MPVRRRKNAATAAAAPRAAPAAQQKPPQPARVAANKSSAASVSSSSPPPPPPSAKQHEPAKAPQQQQRLPTVASNPLINSFVFTRQLFLHLLGLIYFTAFLVAWHQNDGLIGPGGLTPAKTYMGKLVESVAGGSGGSGFQTAWDGFVRHPTLLWFVDLEHTYTALHAITLSGLVLSAAIMLLGRANGVLLLALWLLYFSIDTVGQRWYGFGWESQLLETGFLAAFSCPMLAFSSLADARESPPLGVVVWANRWLMFRLMVGAGLIKLRGDQCWRDLTCVVASRDSLVDAVRPSPAAGRVRNVWSRVVFAAVFLLFLLLLLLCCCW
jgi:hypothetical protein